MSEITEVVKHSDGAAMRRESTRWSMLLSQMDIRIIMETVRIAYSYCDRIHLGKELYLEDID